MEPFENTGTQITPSKNKRRTTYFDSFKIGSHVKQCKTTARNLLSMLCCRFFGMTYRNRDFNSQTAIDILSHKLEIWNYEQEERVFVHGKTYVDVFVEEIITGRAMSNSDYSFLRNLISKINSSMRLGFSRQDRLFRKVRR